MQCLVRLMMLGRPGSAGIVNQPSVSPLGRSPSPLERDRSSPSSSGSVSVSLTSSPTYCQKQNINTIIATVITRDVKFIAVFAEKSGTEAPMNITSDSAPEHFCIHLVQQGLSVLYILRFGQEMFEFCQFHLGMIGVYLEISSFLT